MEIHVSEVGEKCLALVCKCVPVQQKGDKCRLPCRNGASSDPWRACRHGTCTCTWLWCGARASHHHHCCCLCCQQRGGDCNCRHLCCCCCCLLLLLLPFEEKNDDKASSDSSGGSMVEWSAAGRRCLCADMVTLMSQCITYTSIVHCFICLIWMWGAITGCQQPQPWYHGIFPLNSDPELPISYLTSSVLQYKEALICPWTSLKGAKTLYIWQIWMWEAIKGGL